MVKWKVWKDRNILKGRTKNEGKNSKLVHEIPGNICARRLVYYIGMMFPFSLIKVIVMTFGPTTFLFYFVYCGRNT